MSARKGVVKAVIVYRSSLLMEVAMLFPCHWKPNPIKALPIVKNKLPIKELLFRFVDDEQLSSTM